MANVEGKATAITVVTPVRHGGRFLLALVFWVGRHVTSTLEKLHALSFIHYARWAVIRRFPDGGRGERLGHTYLFFESNFNGTWDQYIDAFSEVVPGPHEGDLGQLLRLPGPDPGRAVQGLHPQERVRRQPLLVGLSRRHDDRDHLGPARRGRARRLPTRARPASTPRRSPTAYRALLTDVQRDL